MEQLALAALREFFTDVVALFEQFEALLVAGEIDLLFGRVILKLLHDGVDVAPFFSWKKRVFGEAGRAADFAGGGVAPGSPVSVRGRRMVRSSGSETGVRVSCCSVRSGGWLSV